MNRSDFAHFISLPIQWGDMDSIGHVNNVIYFRYLESGRIDYFNAIEATPGGEFVDGVAPILADIQCSFIGQLHFPATIDIGTRTKRIGNKSIELESGIFLQGEDTPRARGRAVVVWFDYPNQVSAPIPENVRKAITELEVIAPES